MRLRESVRRCGAVASQWSSHLPPRHGGTVAMRGEGLVSRRGAGCEAVAVLFNIIHLQRHSQPEYLRPCGTQPLLVSQCGQCIFHADGLVHCLRSVDPYSLRRLRCPR